MNLRTVGSIAAICGAASCSYPELPDLAPVDASLPCELRYTDVCVNLEGATDRIFAVSADIDTDTSDECAKPPAVLATTPYCILSGASIAIPTGVTLRASGGRPLVFVTSGALIVDGSIDVSSRRATRAPDAAAAENGAAANYVMCDAFRRRPDRNVNGGGGGAGGTFGAIGGDGGDGNKDVTVDLALGGLAPLEPSELSMPLLRGGCKGQDGGGRGPAATDGGTGGAGGGVVLLISKTDIVINGVIAANGAGGTGGGVQAGGAGGGSGGLIVLQAPTVRRNGKLTANGGGGSEGGSIDLDQVIGADGTDGGVNASPAPGGNSPLPASSGGSGGAKSFPRGQSGSGSVDAGGGGGGGVGLIQIYGTTSKSSTAQESPNPVLAAN